MSNKIRTFITSPRGKYYLAIYGVCAVFFGMVVGVLYANNALLMWTSDTRPLYYNYFLYEGEALREAFASLVAGNGFTVNMYSFSLGYGADVFTSGESFLSEPLNLISVFFPPEYAHIGYIALIGVRFALCATTFSWYCFHKGNKEIPTFVATLCFIFSGFILFWGFFRHPNFLTMAIVLPFLLEGADKIFEGKKPYQFIGAVFLIFLISVYFAYMLCLILLVYCLIKYCFTRDNRGIKDFAIMLGKMLIYLLIGAFIASAVWIPTVLVLTQANRVGIERYIPLIEEPRYYMDLVSTFIGASLSSRGAVLGILPTFFALLFVASRKIFPKKVWSSWTVGLVCCLIAACIPFFGSLFNGLSYVTDRWMFALGFCVAYIVCLLVPKLTDISLRSWIIALIIGGALAAISFAGRYLAGSFWGMMATGLFVVVLVGFAVWVWYRQKRKQGFPRQVTRYSYLFACCVLSGIVVMSAGVSVYSLAKSGYGFVKKGSPWENLYTDNLARFAEDISGASVPGVSINNASQRRDIVFDEGLYRFDVPYGIKFNSSGPSNIKNGGLNYRALMVDFYSSIYNQNVDSFRTELGVSDSYLNYYFTGNDSRFALEVFSGVKYIFAHESQTWRLPYAYNATNLHFIDDGGVVDWEAYVTNYASSVGFLSDTIISQSSYEALGMAQKQEALLQATALPDSTPVGMQDATQACTFASKKKSHEIQLGDNIEKTEKGYEVIKKGASMDITFISDADSEVYLCFEGLDFVGKASTKKKAPSSYDIIATMNGHEACLGSINSQNVGYGGKHDWVLFVGKTDAEGSPTIHLSFDEPGTYTIKDLYVVSQPVEPLIEQAKKRQAAGIEDIELVSNGVNASFSLDSDEQRYAVFTFPYSTGWTAEVDGQETKIEKADTAFMAIPVSGTGEHTIQMHYVTPGLKEGACLGIVGLVGLIAVVRYQHRRRS